MTANIERLNDTLKGIALRCLSVLCFALMNACMKWASADHVSAIEMMFYRSVFGLPVILALVIFGPGISSLRTRRPLAHLGRSALGTTGIFCFFQALILLPLADAVTIGFTAPIFSTLLSAAILREKVGVHRYAAVIIGFIGVAIVVRPGGGDVLSYTGMAFILMGAVTSGGVAVTVRQMGGTESTTTIVFWFLSFASVIGGIATIFVGHAHTPHTWMLMIAAGLAGGAAQLFMTASLQAAPVSVVSPFDYTQIIWATLLGWLIWSTPPTLNTIAGAVLITASGIYTAVREHRLNRNLAAATPPLE